jgi:hypothetical protein
MENVALSIPDFILDGFISIKTHKKTFKLSIEIEVKSRGFLLSSPQVWD